MKKNFPKEESETVICYKEKFSGGVNRIGEIIRNNPGITSKELRESIEVSQRTIERWLKQLKGSGKIEFRRSPKSGGYYFL